MTWGTVCEISELGAAPVASGHLVPEISGFTGLWTVHVQAPMDLGQ